MGEIALSDEMFEELKRRGVKSAYYLKAKDILGSSFDFSEELKQSDRSKCNKALRFLLDNSAEIIDNSQCMYLLYRLWWLSTTGYPYCSKKSSC